MTGMLGSPSSGPAALAGAVLLGAAAVAPAIPGLAALPAAPTGIIAGALDICGGVVVVVVVVVELFVTVAAPAPALGPRVLAGCMLLVELGMTLVAAEPAIEAIGIIVPAFGAADVSGDEHANIQSAGKAHSRFMRNLEAVE